MKFALPAFWLESNLTLTYAGHTGKYGVVMLASVALYCLSRALSHPPSMLWSILAGGAVGFMFLEQLDVALFLVSFWAPTPCSWQAGNG